MTILDPRGSADPPLISKIKTLKSHPFNSIFLFFNANLCHHLTDNIFNTNMQQLQKMAGTLPVGRKAQVIFNG